ncbi:extra-large guanine nucleotide-binding protein 1-like [Vitis riparia]|uniref:extra-large guanine nucleotide-binding protein 1-like n=1 Tax=Vitis riparia TaxID=96939 RepID=UPI00155AA639|nr:extra-large guanine nucleotide-binding protein 1-like [Vitis riparia]
MPSETGVDDDGPYSFAMEYHGPPVTYDIPRAVPINVEKIPVATVVAQVSLSDKLSLPVVQPLLAPDPRCKMLSKEIKLGSKSTVSPTSVIAFERGSEDDGGCVSKELDLGSEATVSPTSVIAYEERAAAGHECVLSGELTSSGALEFSDNRYGSSELSDAIKALATVGSSSSSREHSNELLGGAGSSGTIEFSDRLYKSRDLSGSSGAFEVSNGCKESLDFNDLNAPDWVSTESQVSLDYPSSRVSSLKAGDCSNEPGCDVRRTPVVSFRGIALDDDTNEEFSSAEPEIVRPKKEPETKGKKGSCYRCFKGSRFTEKEVCIVCDAKYCSNCVLRAMGSMPEGRKCVTCIGYPIDESKRGNLGKCSRMLKRLLNELEVRQIMKSEKMCETNQLPPEYVCVNEKPLSQEELVLLQNCPNPPKKLKPGNYWYDKVSGLWGKEGQKPSKIISPNLSVGGPIRANASNGNTQVFINGREITKVELRMLQLAGVQCAGNPHFWVNEDGSYQEEGQKNTKGYIWGKAGTKLVCAVLSLPVPSKFLSPSGEQVNNFVTRAVPDYLEQRTLQKLLLIGNNGSGTSTIFKQAKILYKATPFSEDERENIKLKIQSNVYGYLGILLEGRERFEDEILIEMRKRKSYHKSDSIGNTDDENDDKTIYSIGTRLKAFSDWLLKTMVAGNLEAIFPAATREYAPLVEELWNDAAIQATYKRRSELEMLPSVASYFLERAVDILRTDYEPSDVDILYAEGVTSSNGLACVDFSFPQSEPGDDIDTADLHDSLLRYQLIRVQARGLGENCKWLEMFEDVRIVIFCVSLNDYDQYSYDANGSLVNKMMLSQRLFESIVTHPTFEQMDFLLILNKFDLFEEKIERVPLTQCDWFEDFHPVVSRNRSNSNSNNINNSPSLGQLAFHYIAVRFKTLYSSLTGRKLYVSLVKGLELNSVDETLKYAREILKWDEERANFSLSDSVYSTEPSSFSH